ncbi:MAG: hypothetical protein HYR67_14605 [Bacteroidetes bacterium]|nr:hypothetical protein [Bacteroidota bacterium]
MITGVKKNRPSVESTKKIANKSRVAFSNKKRPINAPSIMKLVYKKHTPAYPAKNKMVDIRTEGFWRFNGCDISPFRLNTEFFVYKGLKKEKDFIFH